MLIGWIAYFYVIVMFAVATIAAGRITSGVLMIVFGAILPALLWFALVSKRQKSRLARLEEAQLTGVPNTDPHQDKNSP